jgi:hypothetical protein
MNELTINRGIIYLLTIYRNDNDYGMVQRVTIKIPRNYSHNNFNDNRKRRKGNFYIFERHFFVVE